MKVVIAGNYGAGNLGDELILEGIINSLRGFVENSNITVFSGNPEETKKFHRVEACHKFPSGIRSFIKSIFKKDNKTTRVVKQCNYFILGGGGLFGNLSFRANLIWGIQCFMAYRDKKKVIMLGQSIGPLTNPITKLLVKWLFKKATLISVRDRQSKKRLEDIGVKSEIHVLPDFIFNIEDVSLRNYKDEHPPKKKKLLLALRQFKKTSNESLKQINYFLQWLQEIKNWEIDIINFQTRDTQQSDKKVHRAVTHGLKQKLHTIDLSSNGSRDLFFAYNQFDLVLGMRLHSILSAMKTETPFIALSYAEKIDDLLEDAGLIDKVLKTKNLKTQKIKEKFIKAIEEREKTIASLKVLNETYKAQHLEFKNKILVRLFKPG